MNSEQEFRSKQKLLLSKSLILLKLYARIFPSELRTIIKCLPCHIDCSKVRFLCKFSVIASDEKQIICLFKYLWKILYEYNQIAT